MQPWPDSLGSQKDPEFLELLASALELRERGEPIDTTRVCIERPELRGRLEAALEHIDTLPALHQTVGTFDPAVGQMVGGRYRLHTRLGSGGMGVVYGAVDGELKREVAVKMLRPELGNGGNAELAGRLEREAEVLASVTHPAVVSVFDRGRTEDGQLYVVMPRLDGIAGHELLEAALELDPVRCRGTEWIATRLGIHEGLDKSYIRQVVTWVAEVARGLEVVHQEGAVHRDVKPSNIFLCQDGHAVLLDFGLATLGAEVTLAHRGATIGTPAYMAPEQLSPKSPAGAEVDVYGLTASLYHFLTLRRPYEGSASQVLAALQHKDAPPASKLRPGLPRDMQAILDHGMAREPKHRYRSAASLADDLEAWLDYRPVRARPVSAATRVWRRMRRSTAARTLLAVAVVALAIVGWLAWSTARLDHWRTEYWNRVPSTILFAHAHLRVPTDPNAGRQIETLLDALVANATEPCPSRVIRASFLTDRGDLKAASADMQAVADYYGTALCRALAASYRRAVSAGRPALAEDLRGGLPSPVADVDRCALAIQWARIAEYGTVADTLGDATDTVFGARELALFAQLVTGRAKSRQEQIALYRSVHVAALQLEARRGERSALTANLCAIGLMGQDRFAEATTHLQAALDLSPSDFLAWNNLCQTMQRTGDPDLEDTLAHALAIQSRSTRLHQRRIQALLEHRRFAEAEAALEEVPFPSGKAGEDLRNTLEGDLLLNRALDLRERERHEATEAISDLARRAATLYRSACRPGSIDLEFKLVVCECVTDPTSEALVRLVRYVRRAYVAGSQLDWYRLRLVSILMSNDLDSAQTAAVRDLIKGISASQAPK